MRARILVAEPKDFTADARDILAKAGDLELRACDRAELTAAFSEYDVIWMRLGQIVDEAVLGPQPRARILAIPATGTDHVDHAACAARGVRVLSLRGETEFLKDVRATAELTIGLALALLRRIPAAAESVRDGVWDRDRFRGHELHGRTAGIVGVGRLGTIVARYLAAFDMRVLGFDPRPDLPPHVERCNSIEELMAASDLVTLHVPYAPETRHLIGARQLDAMKPGAVLINTSRGGVVDETALLHALESGRLGGAAVDVLDGEPAIDASHRLVAAVRDGMANLLVVPHIGGNTYESFAKTERFLATKVAAALKELGH